MHMPLFSDIPSLPSLSPPQRKFGWKYQKRPGVEYLLSQLFDFYEIVIFTSDIPMVINSLKHSSTCIAILKV